MFICDNSGLLYLNLTMFQGLILVALNLVDILPGWSRVLKYGCVTEVLDLQGTCINVID